MALVERQCVHQPAQLVIVRTHKHDASQQGRREWVSNWITQIWLLSEILLEIMLKLPSCKACSEWGRSNLAELMSGNVDPIPMWLFIL